MNETIYSSTDLYSVAYLMCKGMSLLELKPDSQNPSRYHFIIRDNQYRKRYIEEYFSGDGIVIAVEYKNRIINLKSLLHNQNKEGEEKK